MLSDIEPIFEEYKKFWTDWAEEVAYLDCRQIKERNKGLRYCWSCPQIWQRMAVWWNGTIMPCNQDDDGLLALGNIKDTTIKEAWQSKELNRIRGMHKEGLAHQITACDGCYLRYNEIKKQLKKGSAQ
jgi:radical SAM protein with 4Fe4S-binding SPASM domain